MYPDYLGGALLLAVILSLFVLAKGQTEKWILVMFGMLVGYLIYISDPNSKLVTTFSDWHTCQSCDNLIAESAHRYIGDVI
jgi:cell division protein FtsW (lipid II flippase)